MNTLYSDLLKLSETRYFMKNDVSLDGVNYRIFNYRIYSLKHFELPNALNARGTMFEMTNEPKLVSLTMKKFFNLRELKEVPTGIMYASEKKDGSLISTYIHKDGLKLKTKNAISSPLVDNATRALEPELHDLLMRMIRKYNCTIDMEFTSPGNKIVLHYPETKLTILSARYHETGEYIDRNVVIGDFPELVNYIVNEYVVDETFLSKVPEMTEIEGFVMRFEDLRFKVKTKEYLELHKINDKLNKKDIFKLFLENKLDDYRNPHNEPMIKDFEENFIPKYVDIIDRTEKFYNENKDLSKENMP
ncbi:hypothetical protein GEMRC1_004972 [Eukaryota sp. GEM-RC1]